MTNWFCNNGDGATTGHWAIAQWLPRTVYATGSIVRQDGGGTFTVGVALDTTHSKIWLYDGRSGLWNNDVIANQNPASNLGGAAYTTTGPFLPAWSANGNNLPGLFGRATANFGATSFVYTMPSGFSSVNTAASATVTWNPADKSASITLSGGNLTAATPAQLNANALVRATNSVSGLVYYEVTINVIGWFQYIGYANATESLSNFVGQSANSFAWETSDGKFIQTNSAGAVIGLQGTPVTQGNERCFKNLGSSGTSGTTQPAWGLGNGGTTADNTVTWTEVTGKTTDAWNSCWARMDSLTSQRLAVNDTVWVGDNHQQYASGITSVSIGGSTNNNYVNYYSVDHTNASPGAGTLLAGAGLSFININGNLTGNIYMVGFTVSNGGTSGGVLNLGTTNTQRYLNCTFTSTIGNARFGFSSSGGANALLFDNCSVTGTAANNPLFEFKGGRAWWRGGSISTGATSDLFDTALGNVSGRMVFEDVDFSGCTGNLVAAMPAAFTVSLMRCKFPTSAFGLPANSVNPGYPDAEWFACDTGANQESFGRGDSMGTQQDNKIVIRTGGATDSLNLYSTKLVASGALAAPFNFRSVPIEVWNSVINANRTITFYGVSLSSNGTMPQNGDIFFTVRYLGSLTSLAGSLASNGVSTLGSASNWSADSSAWDTNVPARQNTHGYTSGVDVIKVASNPGRIFVCTGTGTSAGSEPGGFATAVDGTQIIDGSSIFRACMRFTMALTISAPQPQLVGLMSIQFELVKANLPVFYIDPMPILS